MWKRRADALQFLRKLGMQRDHVFETYLERLAALQLDLQFLSDPINPGRTVATRCLCPPAWITTS